MLTVERSVERATCDVCHLPEVGGTGHKVEQEACPLTDTVVGEEQGGREYQRSGIVLRSTPGETDARIADGIALHLIDCHLSGVALDELNEATALSGRILT